MHIDYRINQEISADQFIALLRQSTLAERRPVEDRACMEGMVKHANLIVSAWHGDTLVGIARSMTDFHYACYLSDLAVHLDYQQQGIGKQLQLITQEQLGSQCKLILIAAPAANDYYAHIGYTNNPRCWVLNRNEQLR